MIVVVYGLLITQDQWISWGKIQAKVKEVSMAALPIVVGGDINLIRSRRIKTIITLTGLRRRCSTMLSVQWL